ncbi:MAG: fumarylacetoacetate hydrolase family protein [Acidimicrobiales bacterium]|nr:fumarylacetoacetate hydrolase family protein [Acidimicrobiales bacterium]
MERPEQPQEIADRLLAAWDRTTTTASISSTTPAFGQEDAYEVLDLIAARRRTDGWQSVGRKIGFTNRSIWEAFGVKAPMWAHLWDRTVVHTTAPMVTLSLDAYVQPRIEPEVVLGLSAPMPTMADASEVMRRVGWIAAGFEIVHCHFPDWEFALADATADFGLHGALVLGPPLVVDDANREHLTAALATFEATLARDGAVVDRGRGANVLGSPAIALAHLAQVIAADDRHPPLGAGEIVTTGTITAAWPIAAGQTWTSHYGALGLSGLTLTLS